MANNNGRMTRTDRFGRPYKLAGARDKSGKGFAKAYIEIGKPGTYEIEVGPSNKPEVEHWVRVTKMEQNRSSAF